MYRHTPAASPVPKMSLNATLARFSRFQKTAKTSVGLAILMLTPSGAVSGVWLWWFHSSQVYYIESSKNSWSTWVSDAESQTSEPAGHPRKTSELRLPT